jgi:large subunit ribosomal protein L32e
MKGRRRRCGKIFIRQQSWFKPGLGKHWRRPHGRHSKLREHKKARQPVVRVGYGSPSKFRGMISNRQSVVVNTINDLKKIEPKKNQAAVIAHTVSLKNISQLMAAAKAMGVDVLNTRRMRKASHRIYVIEQTRKAAQEKAAAKEGKDLEKEAVSTMQEGPVSKEKNAGEKTAADAQSIKNSGDNSKKESLVSRQ